MEIFDKKPKETKEDLFKKKRKSANEY